MASQEVAIIGAGLSGLALALALHKQGLPATLYESRHASLDIGGAIMLSPNALKILESIGVYERIAPKGYHFDNLYFRAHDKIIDTFEFGNKEKFGYRGFRIYRHELITQMLDLLREKNIPIVYNKKFVNIVSETQAGVTWDFDDGTQGTAAFLVGADGIHSKVRKYLYPDLEPKFTQAVGVTAAVPTAQLKAPKGYSLPVTIMNKTHGAFVIAPQLVDGSEVLIGKQRRAPEVDREGWDKLLENKEWCVEFLRQGADDFPPIVRNAVSEIPLDKINLWPFYIVPKLDTWVSSQCRVVIVGDAAHAIPPTAGQGVNQAFEDVYMYAAVLAACKKTDTNIMAKSLKLWQRFRQERVDKVLDVNEAINKRRMPTQAGKTEAELQPFELEWLYAPDFDVMVQEWLKAE